MMLQLLIPAVEDAEEADLGTEMLRVGGNFHQGLSAAAEQQPVDQWFVLQSQGRQLVRESEDDMGIGCREQFGVASGQPTIARLALALGAVPIATTVIGDGSMAAGRALVQMAAHGSSATTLDRAEHFEMQPGEPRGWMICESVPRSGYDIGHLQQWPCHSILMAVVFRGLRERERVERTGGGSKMSLGKVQVAAGRFQIGVAEQQLNGTQIRARFEKVGSEAVPEGVRVDALVESCPRGRLLHGVPHALGGHG